MSPAPMSEQRRTQLSATADQLRRRYPGMTRDDALLITSIVVDAFDAQPHPDREWAARVVRTALDYVRAYERNPNAIDVGIMRRRLQEVFAHGQDQLSA